MTGCLTPHRLSTPDPPEHLGSGLGPCRLVWHSLGPMGDSIAAPACSVPDLDQEGKSDPPAKQGKAVSDKLSGLALTWDDTSFIRQRLRDGNNLLQNYDPKLKIATNHHVEKNIKNVRINAAVLAPVCRMAREHGGLLPNIDKLAVEVKGVYRLNKVIVSTSMAFDQGWSIRHLISVLKGSVKARRVGKKTGSTEKIWSWPKDHDPSMAKI